MLYLHWMESILRESLLIVHSIKFIAYYHDITDSVLRNDSPAGRCIIDYIVNCLSGHVDNIEIISPSWVIGERCHWIHGFKSMLSKNIMLTVAPSIGGSRLFSLIAKKTLSRIWLIFYLLFNVINEEVLLVYHAPSLMFPIRLIAYLKQTRIIMITEELYSDIDKHKNTLSLVSEIKYLQKMSAYIFPTELLNNVVNTTDKPYLILHGAYNVNVNHVKNKKSGKHIVYAGTFEPEKGVLMAIDTARYLTDDYHLHIIGYGTKEQTKQVIQHIQEVAPSASCRISYDGFLSGQEYTQFIQQCDIGLCTQNPKASFTMTSFPSKILSYLSNGLKVVSVRIEAVEKSRVASCVWFYDNNTPQDVAQAIETAAASDADGLMAIKLLDQDFKSSLSKLIYRCER